MSTVSNCFKRARHAKTESSYKATASPYKATASSYEALFVFLQAGSSYMDLDSVGVCCQLSKEALQCVSSSVTSVSLDSTNMSSHVFLKHLKNVSLYQVDGSVSREVSVVDEIDIGWDQEPHDDCQGMIDTVSSWIPDDYQNYWENRDSMNLVLTNHFVTWPIFTRTPIQNSFSHVCLFNSRYMGEHHLKRFKNLKSLEFVFVKDESANLYYADIGALDPERQVRWPEDLELLTIRYSGPFEKSDEFSEACFNFEGIGKVKVINAAVDGRFQTDRVEYINCIVL